MSKKIKQKQDDKHSQKVKQAIQKANSSVKQPPQPAVEICSKCTFCNLEIVSRLLQSHIKVCQESPSNQSQRFQLSRSTMPILIQDSTVTQVQQRQRPPPEQNIPPTQQQRPQQPPIRPQLYQPRDFFSEPMFGVRNILFNSENFNTNRTSQTFQQVPNNPLSFDYQGIFGPNGVFTQSMNQMSEQMNRIFSQTNQFAGMTQDSQVMGDGGIQIRTQHFSFPPQLFLFESGRPIVPQPHRGMNPEEIREIPTTTYREPRLKKNEESSMNKNCVICLLDFKSGDRLRTLECNHKYHKDCIDQWLPINGQCPICRCDLK